MNNKSILIFGAGKIGRSFIGQLFGRSGYEVVFADTDQALVNELNRRRSYPVVIKGEKDQILIVENVRAIDGHKETEVIREIARTSVMAVSVGKNALEKVIPVLAEGLKLRQQLTPGRVLDIIIAENMRSAAEFIYSRLSRLLPENFPINEVVGLVETSIGKMVPIMTEEDLKHDPLLIFAEPYNTLILDKQGFKGPVPEINGLCPKENMKAWVDRKAFIHNMGHSAAAYIGNYYYPKAEYISDVLSDKKILYATRNAMSQAAEILINHYPEVFTTSEMEEHIDDLLERFQNKALKDTIYRVGQDLPRKLGIDDRFAGIIKIAQSKNLNYEYILEAMAYAFFFDSINDRDKVNSPDKLFLKSIVDKGVKQTLTTMCGFNPVNDQYLLDQLEKRYISLKQQEAVMRM